MNPKTLIIMQGLPGSGKSTIAGLLLAALSNSWTIDGKARFEPKVFSTDEYWYDKNGFYAYDPERIYDAHQWNQARVENAMRDGLGPIITDNTNMRKQYAQPYFDLAGVFGYDVQVVTVQCPLHVALQRNLDRTPDRAVPSDTVIRMYAEMERLL